MTVRRTIVRRLSSAGLAIATALLLLPVGGADCRAGRALTVGQRVADRITVGGKQIPLPRGDWSIAGLGTQLFDRPELGAYGAIENVILFRRHGGRVVAAIEINSNAVPVDDGWGWSPTCQRAAQFLLLTRYRSGWDLSCLSVQPTYAPAGGPGPRAWREALRAAALAGEPVPVLWLTAAFRISDRQDVVDVRYHFAPDILIGRLAGRAGAPADWSSPAVAGDPDRIAAVRLLSSWAVGADEAIERGLRNQLADPALDMPGRAAFFSNTPQIDAKLRDLERLHRHDALPAAEYLTQEQVALTEVPVLSDGGNTLNRTIERSLSLRALNSLVDYVLGLAITVGAPVSGWLTAPVVLAYSTVFVLNDRFWEGQWSRLPGYEATRTVEFVHLGVPA